MLYNIRESIEIIIYEYIIEIKQYVKAINCGRDIEIKRVCNYDSEIDCKTGTTTHVHIYKNTCECRYLNWLKPDGLDATDLTVK